MATVLFALHQMTKAPALWHPVSVAWQELGDCGDLPKWVALPSDSLGNSSRVNSKRHPSSQGTAVSHSTYPGNRLSNKEAAAIRTPDL